MITDVNIGAMDGASTSIYLRLTFAVDIFCMNGGSGGEGFSGGKWSYHSKSVKQQNSHGR